MLLTEQERNLIRDYYSFVCKDDPDIVPVLVDAMFRKIEANDLAFTDFLKTALVNRNLDSDLRKPSPKMH